MLGIMPGVLNDPSNVSLRRAILQYGLSQFCHEMTTHDAPLTLAPDAPVIGRFYPTQCNQQSLPNGDLLVQFSGQGYGYTNLSKKVTFTTGAEVDYIPDFQMSGSTMYVYFKPRRIEGSTFQSRVIEQPVASFLASLTQVGDTFGKQIVAGKLGDGFTVIRDSGGSADFALGTIPVGQKPPHPFDVHGSGRVTYENARVDVHQGERDFIGPIEVPDSGRALYVSGTLDGAQAIDVMLLQKDVGDQSLRYFLDYAQTGPLAGQPMVSDVMQTGIPYSHPIPVPPGTYWIVLDNTPTAGTAMPPVQFNPLDDRAATVSYVVQIGDAP